MTPAFVIRPEAEADIHETFNWYEDHSPGLGDEFLAAVGESLDAVRESPGRFPIVYREAGVEIRRILLRRFPYGLYFIWQEAGTGGVAVIACMHGRRNPRRWRRRV